MNITINQRNEGDSPTIKSNYYKVSLANFTRGGQRFLAPGIIKVPDDGTKWKHNVMWYEIGDNQ